MLDLVLHVYHSNVCFVYACCEFY